MKTPQIKIGDNEKDVRFDKLPGDPIRPDSLQWRGSQASLDHMQEKAIRLHFSSHKHLSGGCGPVCTFGAIETVEGDCG